MNDEIARGIQRELITANELKVLELTLQIALTSKINISSQKMLETVYKIKDGLETRKNNLKED